MTSSNVAYASGVLLPEVHDRLVQDIDSYAKRANIPAKMIWSKLSDHCSPVEVEFVRTIKKQPDAGLVYIGSQSSVVMNRMMAVTGALLRNFVDAKMMTLQEVLPAIQETAMPDPSVLLIPNFFVSRSDGGKIAEWHIANLLGLLYGRMSRGRKTFLYVANMADMKKTYGDPLYQHLNEHYVGLPV